MKQLCSFLLFALLALGACSDPGDANAAVSKKDTINDPKNTAGDTTVAGSGSTLDTALFNQKVQHLVNGDSSGKWPVKTEYPLPGAILPFKRIIAFYGNLYSKQMGIRRYQSSDVGEFV